MTTCALPFELADGTTLSIVACHHAEHYTANVLRDESPDVWVVTWSDGINDWTEKYDLPWHAFARLAALVAAVEQDVFLVHDLQDGNPDTHAAVVDEVERFVSRTVHTSSCEPGCDGTDRTNHQV